jgi:hypothetical protein
MSKLNPSKYIDLTPFQAWVQQSLPAIYDDSLSYSDLLAKMLAYLNRLVENNNTLSTDVTNAINYINTFFESTDFQDKVDDKLNRMASDGSLSKLIQPLFDAYKAQIDEDFANFKNQTNQTVATQNSSIANIQSQQNTLKERMNTFTKLPEGSTSGDAELQDIRVGANGITYNSAGDAVRGQYIDTDTKNSVLNLCLNQFNNTGYVVYTNGNIMNDPTGFKSTGFIEIPNSKQIIIRKCAYYEVDGLAFYDKYKKFIIGFNKESFNDEYLILNIDKKWKYIRLGCKETDVKYQFVGVSHIENNQTIESNNVLVNPDLTGIEGCDKSEDVSKVTIYDDHAHIASDTSSTKSGIITKDFSVNTQYNYATAYYSVKNLIGQMSLSVIYADKTGAYHNEILKMFTKDESGIYNVDIDNYIVYKNLDVNKTIAFQILSRGVAIGDVYTLQGKVNMFAGIDIAKKNISDTILSIQNKLNSKYDKQDIIETQQNYLISPSGEKYIPIINDEGAVSYIPVMPNNVLFVGNSLLLGFGSFGMCAKNSSHDYYHYVTEYIKQNKSLISNKLSGVNFEDSTSIDNVNSWMNATLKPQLNNNLQLVIIQLGDNVNTPEKIATFKTSCKSLLKYIRTKCPNARVCWVGEWYSTTEKQKIINDSCNKLQCQFIDISDLNIEENRSYIGAKIDKGDGNIYTVENSGIASHPGNKGMRLIANRILYQLGIADSNVAFDENYDN